MTTRDNRDYIRVLLYSYYTTISGCGVLRPHVRRNGNHKLVSYWGIIGVILGIYWNNGKYEIKGDSGTGFKAKPEESQPLPELHAAPSGHRSAPQKPSNAEGREYRGLTVKQKTAAGLRPRLGTKPLTSLVSCRNCAQSSVGTAIWHCELG